ncbi:uncharacterized protein METZ01_LOCUS444281 [marine metagenome]|uniref:Uncharacterized protein n=1 Tax=marine metagenome TaxID=408172 RepID=A0A382Z7F4_9ZZZZ
MDINKEFEKLAEEFDESPEIFPGSGIWRGTDYHKGSPLKFKVGGFYHSEMETKSGMIITYFRADHLDDRSEGEWVGALVRSRYGSMQGVHHTSVSENMGNWVVTPKKDIPRQLKKVKISNAVKKKILDNLADNDNLGTEK